MNPPIKKLSIFIPTFNRVQKLTKSLKALSTINSISDVDVVVIDNASTDGTKAAVDNLAVNGNYDLTYIKNDTNIGANANILRCIEKCKSEWIWIIGDDDMPKIDAITTIHRYINSDELGSSSFINFSTESMLARQENIICNGLNEFLEKFDHYPNILFLSTSVFNCSRLKSYIRFGYLYSYSLAPHLAILLSMLNENKGEQVVLSKDMIVDYGPVESKNQKWSYFNLFLGISCLLEIPTNAGLAGYRNFSGKLGANVILDRMLFDYVIKYYLDNPFLRKHLFNQIVLRNYKYHLGKSLRAKIRLLGYWLLINNDVLLCKYIKFRKIDTSSIYHDFNIQPLHNRL